MFPIDPSPTPLSVEFQFRPVETLARRSNDQSPHHGWKHCAWWHRLEFNWHYLVVAGASWLHCSAVVQTHPRRHYPTTVGSSRFVDTWRIRWSLRQWTISTFRRSWTSSSERRGDLQSPRTSIKLVDQYRYHTGICHQCLDEIKQSISQLLRVNVLFEMNARERTSVLHSSRIQSVMTYYTCNMNLELQTRAVEYTSLFTKHNTIRYESSAAVRRRWKTGLV